jgi:hypothetical protein
MKLNYLAPASSACGERGHGLVDGVFGIKTINNRRALQVQKLCGLSHAFRNRSPTSEIESSPRKAWARAIPESVDS